MNRIVPFVLLLLLSSSLLLSGTGCQKKEEQQTNTCKTCKAISSSGTVEKQVCSPAEEQAFRNENAGREISCR